MKTEQRIDNACRLTQPFLCVDLNKEWLLAKKRDTPFGKRVKVSN